MTTTVERGWQAQFAKDIGTSTANVARWIERGMPEGDTESARLWVASNTRHTVSTSALDGILADATPDMDGPLGAYARARDAEKKIASLIDTADSKELLALVTAHSKACGSLADRASEASAYIENTRALMPTGELMAALSGHIGATVSIARSMPRTLGPRLEGMSVDQRIEELERWVENTLLMTLRETEPFKNDTQKDT